MFRLQNKKKIHGISEHIPSYRKGDFWGVPVSACMHIGQHCKDALRDEALRIQQGALCFPQNTRCHCAYVNVMALMYITKLQPSVGLCSQNSIMRRYLTPNFTKLRHYLCENTNRNSLTPFNKVRLSLRPL